MPFYCGVEEGLGCFYLRFIRKIYILE